MLGREEACATPWRLVHGSTFTREQGVKEV